MEEFWINRSNENLLQGIPGSYKNPAKLPNHVISGVLGDSLSARESFLRLLPTMLPEEQVRLAELWTPLIPSEQEVVDSLIHRSARKGIRLVWE